MTDTDTTTVPTWVLSRLIEGAEMLWTVAGNQRPTFDNQRALDLARESLTRPYLVTSPDGTILGRYRTPDERDLALLTSEYPDNAEPAYEA